jgi:hypothetical protein
MNRFLKTHDKEYSLFNERIDRLRKSTSRDRGAGGNSSSGDNKMNSSKSFIVRTFRNNVHINSNDQDLEESEVDNEDEE